jgi:UDP-N-acetylmuramate--alanine ligase
MLTNEELYKLKIEDLKKIHMIGICSPFGSFCAQLLLNRGINLTASEHNQASDQAAYWLDKSVLYAGPHNAEFITDDIDLVIYPNGVIPNNPECMQAEMLKIPSITLGQLTGFLTQDFKTIAIAGTHGKSTTASAITYMLSKLDILPNFVVGDASVKINKLDKNWNVSSSSKYFVVEACEYKKQFLDRAPKPYISVITNIELDHTDYYPTQENYNKAFEEFIANTQDTLIMDLTRENEKVVYKNSNYTKVVQDVADFNTLEIASELKGSLNQQNLLRAYLVGISLGYSDSTVREALSTFSGLTARFEYLGESRTGAIIHIDYAHNPAKIAFCLATAKEVYPEKRVTLVFQPHSYERTNSFKNEFADAVRLADIILIPNIFSPARDAGSSKDIQPEEFVEILKTKNPNKTIMYTESFEKTATWLNENTGNEDVILLASAGDLRDLVPLIQ